MIPKIIHQIYFNLHNKELSEIPLFKTSSERIKKMYPDWKYCLWTENDCLDLMNAEFPEHVEFYKSMRYDIQRIDYMRFAILRSMGGVYVDLDLIPIRKMDEVFRMQPFFTNTLRGLIPNHNEYVQNDFMGSYEHFGLWKYLMDYLPENYKEKADMEIYDVRKARFVLQTTGPRYLSRMLKKLMPKYTPHDKYIFTKWKNDNWKKVNRDEYFFENYVSCSWAHSVSEKLYIKDTFYLKEEEL